MAGSGEGRLRIGLGASAVAGWMSVLKPTDSASMWVRREGEETVGVEVASSRGVRRRLWC